MGFFHILCPRILLRITPKGRDSSTTPKWEVHLRSICGTWNSAFLGLWSPPLCTTSHCGPRAPVLPSLFPALTLEGLCDFTGPTGVIEVSLNCKVMWLAYLISCATVIPLCYVKEHVHRCRESGCGARLGWGGTVLTAGGVGFPSVPLLITFTLITWLWWCLQAPPF